MFPKKNPYELTNPTLGSDYKLWSLPIGTTVIRKNLKIENKKIKNFTILEQHGNFTICKSDKYEFYLDSSIVVTIG